MNVNKGHLVSLDQGQVIRVPVLLDVLPVVGVEHHLGQLDQHFGQLGQVSTKPSWSSR